MKILSVSQILQIEVIFIRFAIASIRPRKALILQLHLDLVQHCMNILKDTLLKQCVLTLYPPLRKCGIILMWIWQNFSTLDDFSS